MIKKHNISNFKNLFIRVLCIVALSAPCFFIPNIQAQSVSVFAGIDQTICGNDTLLISNLDATIYGAVNDGYWFSNGDGYFLPIQPNNRFSITTHYIPGPMDISNGFVNLLLVSDDPDGIGPLVQVTDQVRINFMGNIALICNSNLNISLSNDCTQKVTPSMLVTNIQQPIDYYTLTIKDQFNQTIPNNILTNEHIGKSLEYTVGHQCGGNTCWGNINVQDKLPPPLFCTNKTVTCGTNTLPEGVGFPIPTVAKARKIGTNKYRVTGLDACGPATLSFSDAYISFTCENPLQGRITRTWTAIDSFGNASTCSETISIRNKTLAQVVLPPNFDGTAKPSFQCDGIWPKLPNGFPSPDTTGIAETKGCTNLESTFTDAKFEQCGASYKILRKWTIINWCGTLTLEHNQLIKVIDSKAPTFTCPSDITLNASAYDCANALDTLPYPTNVFDCSATTLKVNVYENVSNIDYTYLVFSGNNGKKVISNLPIGIYYADYIMLDACGNSDTCRAFITVIDKSVPIAICDQFTKVSLTTNGFARLNALTIDDGSFDNCQIATMKVAKMIDLCSGNALVFGDYVDYCCAEANSSVMTVLRVTDNFGNSNSCMVEVQVQDKIAPIINCPTNLTISCKNGIDTTMLSKYGIVVNGIANRKPITILDEYNNGVAGYDGYYTDNCDAVITSKVIDNTKCSQGVVIRTFTATDKNNNTASCQQTITIRDPLPFNANHIVWPNPTVEVNGCDASVATLAVTGQPTFSNVNCASVAATFEDKLFYNTDGVCLKILREWTVVDWCQFDANTGYGKWLRNQTIKVNNTVAPQFEEICKDTTFCLFTDNCGAAKYTFLPAAFDDCTPPQDITAEWKIDINNDGSIDSTGTSRLLAVYLKAGKHKVHYTIIDKCHNKTTCSFIVTAVDCKKPTPYCSSQLTSVLMPNSGTLAIKAKSFDLGSFDNCTEASKLKFSFTTNTLDTTRLLSCADIQDGVSDTINLKMWVTDLAGNNEYCVVDFILYDNDDVCQDKNLNAAVEGKIYAADLIKSLGNVEMKLTAQKDDYSSVKYTDAKGLYSATGFPGNMPVTIRPFKNDSIRAGLSTLDIIFIQRHILGTARFTDPYKIIAADVDDNKKVSVTDLVVLRKIILGATDILPKNRNCYTFVPVDHQFEDKNKPFNYPDSIRFERLNILQKNYGNFVGIKIGDVNNTIGNNVINDLSNRSDNLYLKSKIEYGNTIFYFDQEAEITGLQFALDAKNINAQDILLNDKMGEVHFEIVNGKLRLMLYDKEVIQVKAGIPLFTIKNSMMNDFLPEAFNEYYDVNFEAHPLKIQKDVDGSSNDNHTVLLVSMAQNHLTIQSDTSIQNVKVMLSDALGRVVYRKRLDLVAGLNHIDMGTPLVQGIKIAQIMYGDRSKTVVLY